MAFMKPQYEEGSWYEVEMEGDHTFWLPSYLFRGEPTADDVRQFCGLPYASHRTVQGVGARLSAPGYLDCTDWDVFPDMASARQHVEDFYEVDPDTGDDLIPPA